MGQLIDGRECVIKAVHITEALEAEKEAAIGVGIPFKGHLLILSAPPPVVPQSFKLEPSARH